MGFWGGGKLSAAPFCFLPFWNLPDFRRLRHCHKIGKSNPVDQVPINKPAVIGELNQNGNFSDF